MLASTVQFSSYGRAREVVSLAYRRLPAVRELPVRRISRLILQDPTVCPMSLPYLEVPLPEGVVLTGRAETTNNRRSTSELARTETFAR